MSKSPYPAHISDPLRIEIAQKLILHEFKKLFTHLSNNEINKIENEIKYWPTKGGDYQLAGLRDFWNGIDGIMMGFKLKNIVPLITAENIYWSKKNISTDILVFGVNFPPLMIKGKTGQEVREYFKKNSKALAREKKISDQSFSNSQREDDAIVAIKDQGGKIVIHDGNGRLKRALIYSKKFLSAYVGHKTNNQPPVNFWVPTGLLIQLVKLSETGLEDEVIKILIELLKQSQSAVYEFSERALAKDHPLRVKVLKRIKKFKKLRQKIDTF